MQHSPSSLKLFDNCPHRFLRERILCDVSDQGSDAAQRGRAAHEVFERAALGEQAWPEEYAHVRDHLALVCEQPAATEVTARLEDVNLAVEVKLALDAELRPAAWDDGWMRGIVDALALDGKTARVIDYKTGKKRPQDSAMQMRFYALAVFRHLPKVERVVTDLFWTRTNEHTLRTWTRDRDEDALADSVKAACARVENATAWPKRRSGLCGYCPVSDCQFWRPNPETMRSIPNLRFV